MTVSTGAQGSDANIVLIGVCNLTSSNTTATSARLRLYQSGSSTKLAETGITWAGDGVSGTVVARFTLAPNSTRDCVLRIAVDNLSGGSSTKSNSSVRGQLIMMTAKK